MGRGMELIAKLTWRDLRVCVNGNQVLLHGLTGYAEEGRIMAIMGPSGSGKSTLLDSLAGRLAKNAILTGEILVNGRPRQLSYGTAAAYVTQDDNLIATLTVLESIQYSANLRLPSSMPKKDKEAMIWNTINAMGLQESVHTPVGNWHMRGLSGGEKRRVSIALEILTRPRLLFLDEPTSGLDSASAYFVVRTLLKLARDGRTVIASIHQPSTEVFELFDDLFLLSGGRTMYFGKLADAGEHFSQAGFPCPPLRGPSDHYLRCVNADFDKVMKSLKASFRHPKHCELESLSRSDVLDGIDTSEVVNILSLAYESSQLAAATAERVLQLSKPVGNVLFSRGSQAGFLMQSYTLTKRSFKNMRRDYGYYWLRLVMYIMLSLSIGTIFRAVGNEYTSIGARAACMSYIAGFLTFMSIGGFPTFVEDMKVFTRERMNGHYGVVAFVIGNTISSLPFLFLISLVSSLIVYPLVHLHWTISNYSYFLLSLFAAVTVVESLMMAVASLVPNFLMGIITGAAIQGIFLLVSGFFRLPRDLPVEVWRYPMFYLGFHMYILQGMYENDFQGLTFIDNGPNHSGEPLTGEYILENFYQIDLSRSKWFNLVILAGMVVLYRIIFLMCIKYSEVVHPWLRACWARTAAGRHNNNKNTSQIERKHMKNPSSDGRTSHRLSLQITPSEPPVLCFGKGICETFWICHFLSNCVASVTRCSVASSGSIRPITSSPSPVHDIIIRSSPSSAELDRSHSFHLENGGL